jgi:endonuclease YncB( thermonuclease family)
LLYPAELPGHALLPSMFAPAVQSLCLAIALVAAGGAVAADCPVLPGQAVEVGAIVDGRTFRTAGEQTVRIAGVEGLHASATAALPAMLAAGVEVRRLDKREDRWGRVVADVHAGGMSIAERLISEGHAHAAITSDGLCARRLLDAEAAARAARRGIWASDHAIRGEDGERLHAAIGHHVVVEGRITSARPFRDRLYVNLGRDRRRSATLVVRDRELSVLPIAAKDDAASLAGRMIRMRGYLEWRGGPVILANVREPIEILDTR